MNFQIILVAFNDGETTLSYLIYENLQNHLINIFNLKLKTKQNIFLSYFLLTCSENRKTGNVKQMSYFFILLLS